MIRYRQNLLCMLLLSLLLGACGRAAESVADPNAASRPIRVVATTTMVADLVRQIGGARVDVTGLMGPGVDPHMYKASESAVTQLASADLIFYNGLHLEAKLTEVFEKMQKQTKPVAVAEAIDVAQLLSPPDFAGAHDPHVWFDVSLWMQAAARVQAALIAHDPAHAATYEQQGARYLAELAELQRYIQTQVERIPTNRRVLITAHDAFNYFGRAYGFEVLGLQGISTATEAATSDVQALAALIAERQIPAIFVESSVSPRTIEAVQAAVRTRGFDVQIGGELFSDALGNPDSEAGTYSGMIRHNIDTLVQALTR